MGSPGRTEYQWRHQGEALRTTRCVTGRAQARSPTDIKRVYVNASVVGTSLDDHRGFGGLTAFVGRHDPMRAGDERPSHGAIRGCMACATSVNRPRDRAPSPRRTQLQGLKPWTQRRIDEVNGTRGRRLDDKLLAANRFDARGCESRNSRLTILHDILRTRPGSVLRRPEHEQPVLALVMPAAWNHGRLGRHPLVDFGRAPTVRPHT